MQNAWASGCVRRDPRGAGTRRDARRRESPARGKVTEPARRCRGGGHARARARDASDELNILFVGRLQSRRPRFRSFQASFLPLDCSTTTTRTLPFFHSTQHAHRRPGMTKPRTSPGTPPGVAVGGGGAAARRRVISRTTYAQHQPPLLSSQRTPIKTPIRATRGSCSSRWTAGAGSRRTRCSSGASITSTGTAIPSCCYTWRHEGGGGAAPGKPRSATNLPR